MKKTIRVNLGYAEAGITLTIIFFILYFLYFFIFNRYHLAFQEQIQLFVFDSNYFTGFLARPGGLSEYAGSFFTQFFGNHFAAALILTLAGLAVFAISGRIFSASQSDFLSYIPVLALAALHSSHLYSFSYSVAFIAALSWYCIYLVYGKRETTLMIILFSWPLLFVMAGGFAVFSGILFLIHYLLSGKGKFWIPALFACGMLLIPVLLSGTVYFVEQGNIFTSLVPLKSGQPVKYLIIFLLLYFPVVMLVKSILPKKEVNSSPKLQHASRAGTFILVTSLSFVVFRSFHDKNTELLLGIDHDIRKSDWKAALDKSLLVSQPNRMVLHYTNFALYKSGLLLEKLFWYPQSGRNGLWLDWQQDWLIAFFGCGTYYELGYNSEAYRWAYEAMVAKGPNPRSLKLLSLSSIVDGNTDLASKYLKLLQRTWFYHSWADHYLAVIEKPGLKTEDRELSSKKNLLLNSDFINANNPGGRLMHLLREHPDNRMAFEYMMASLLLEKDLDGLVANIDRIKDYGYTKLPGVFEEALAAYMSYQGGNIVPEGYTVSRQTLERLSAFFNAVSLYGADSDVAAERLYPKFGKTYWYYLKFVDHQKPLY